MVGRFALFVAVSGACLLKAFAFVTGKGACTAKITPQAVEWRRLPVNIDQSVITREARTWDRLPASWGGIEKVQIHALRCALSAAIPLCWVFRERIDSAVATAWSALYSLPLAHHCMFEAMTATLGFVAAICFWSSAHVLFWRRDARQSAMARFRIDGRSPVAPFEWLGQLGRRRLTGAWLPLVAYLGSIAAFHLVVVKPPLPAESPTFWRFVVEVACGVVAYDLLFWPIHASLHAGPRWWRNVHRTHHEARPPERRGSSLVPLETVQHSYCDGFLQVATNVAVQRMRFFRPSLMAAPFAKHPLSRIAHNLIVTYLLAEAHSGYDLPWMSHRLLPGIFGGALAHDDHHVRGAPNYHQFFRFPTHPSRARKRTTSKHNMTAPTCRARSTPLALTAKLLSRAWPVKFFPSPGFVKTK